MTGPAAAGIGPICYKLLSQLRKGDVLVVWTLDRLSRSLRDVLTIMERVQERHAGFRSLKEAVDTTTPAPYGFRLSAVRISESSSLRRPPSSSPRASRARSWARSYEASPL